MNMKATFNPARKCMEVVRDGQHIADIRYQPGDDGIPPDAMVTSPEELGSEIRKSIEEGLKSRPDAPVDWVIFVQRQIS